MALDSQFLALQTDYTRWSTLSLLKHVRLASDEELQRDLKTSFKSILGTLQHTYQADAVWLARLLGNPLARLDETPTPDQLEALAGKWEPVLEGLVRAARENDPLRVVPFRRMNGEEMTLPVWQILLHVINHGTWHRGQVITNLRQLGHPGLSLDMIVYYRDLARAAAH